jgi:hypothetical protein
LATDSVTVLRPALSSISPSWMKSSPGIILRLSPSFRGARSANPESRNYNLWIPRCAIAHLRFGRSGRPGMTNSPDRFMHGDEFCPIRKRRLHLDIVNHLGDPRHALRAGQDLRAGLHQIGDGAAIAGALDDEIGDDRDSLTPRSSRRRATMAAIEIKSLSFSRGDRFMRALEMFDLI